MSTKRKGMFFGFSNLGILNLFDNAERRIKKGISRGDIIVEMAARILQDKDEGNSFLARLVETARGRRCESQELALIFFSGMTEDRRLGFLKEVKDRPGFESVIKFLEELPALKEKWAA